MDKIDRIKNRNTEGNYHRDGLRTKQAVLQPSGPGRAFKGLDSAKRYCRKNSIGDRFSQGWSHPLGLISQADAPSFGSDPFTGPARRGRPALRTWRASKGPC